METNPFYARLGDAAHPIGEAAKGASGYFSTPSDHLDPNLFEGTTLHPWVREHLLNRLYDYWGGRLLNATLWSHVWLAGSGISYQWAADRGNGDLDVLIGIDWPVFFNSNDYYAGLSQEEAAENLNSSLKENLWPQTANTRFGERTYEVTYYVNHNSRDIRNINPYAAYDLTDDTWTVAPPELPEDPRTLYPEDYTKAAKRDLQDAVKLKNAYDVLRYHLRMHTRGSAQWVNNAAELNLNLARAAALYDEIHLGRRAAFQPGGLGYSDFHNFRWQAAKESGAAQILRELKDVSVHALDANAINLYGRAIDNAAQARAKAAMWGNIA